jgi:hypothetical protein
LGAISPENERTVSLLSNAKLSSIGAKATTILSILAAASANFDARHRKTQSREIPKKLQGLKRRRMLTADYAKGPDKEEL